MRKIASLLLCMGLCMGLSNCLAAGTAYEEAVAGLREVGYGTYREEQTYDSGLCTLFSYSVLAPHGPYAHLALVYKAGSPLGEGAVVSLPVPDGNFWGASSAPDQLNWDPEGGRLTVCRRLYNRDVAALGKLLRGEARRSFRFEETGLCWRETACPAQLFRSRFLVDRLRPAGRAPVNHNLK